MTHMPTVEADLAVAVSAPRRPLRKRMLVPVVGLAALVCAGVYAVHWWGTGRFLEETDDAYIGADVTVIGPKVAGYIEEVLVSDNQAVKAGDVLIRLDARDYRANLAKAEGAVAAEEALLANLDATEQLQQAVIGQARAGIDAAGAETARSRDDNARYKRLVTTNAVSVESAQRADATFKTAQALSARAQAELLAAQRQLAVIDTQKQQARAALQQARAERDLAQLNLGYTELRAPVDGVIGNRRARVGAYAQAGSQQLSVVAASVQQVIVVTARLQSKPSPSRDAPAPQRDKIEVETADFDDGKRQVLDRLPDGWIVAAWLVGRPPANDHAA